MSMTVTSTITNVGESWPERRDSFLSSADVDVEVQPIGSVEVVDMNRKEGADQSQS